MELLQNNENTLSLLNLKCEYDHIVKSSLCVVFTVFNTFILCSKRNIKADPKQSSGAKKQKNKSDNFLIYFYIDFQKHISHQVTLKDEFHTQILRPSHPINFYVSPNSSCANMAICYNLLIINQWCVNSNGMSYLNSPPQNLL